MKRRPSHRRDPAKPCWRRGGQWRAAFVQGHQRCQHGFAGTRRNHADSAGDLERRLHAIDHRAASMVSPGPGDAMDVASSRPTFTWQAYPSAHTYDLMLFDAMGNVAWIKVGLLAVTGQNNTATYDGATPLASGKVYQWRALARGNAGNPISQTEELRGIFRIQ